jgi:hypothetical protein
LRTGSVLSPATSQPTSRRRRLRRSCHRALNRHPNRCSMLLLTNACRTAMYVVVTAWASFCAPAVSAQQGDAPSPVSVERVRAALLTSNQPPITGGAGPVILPTRSDEWRWGVLTFLPPNIAGEFVRVRVPVGALVSHAAHSLRAAGHRRAENAAHDEVVKALADFQNAQRR